MIVFLVDQRDRFVSMVGQFTIVVSSHARSLT